MTKTTLLITLLWTIAISLQAQKLKKIDKILLTQTQHQDSTASAAYIQNNCKISFQFNGNKINLVSEYTRRIKIYTEKGEKYANITIPLYHQGSRKERITNIKAVTYNLVNGNIEEDKLHKKHDVYEEKSSENWIQVKFALPNVREGSVIDISYRVISPFIYQLDRWFFQHEIPVDESIYKLVIPSYFSYTPVPTGFHPMAVENKEYLGSKHGETENTFTAANVPAVKDDEYVLHVNDYQSSIKYELYAVTFPNTPTKYYSKDWNVIGKDLLNSDLFGKEIKKKIKDPTINALIEEVTPLEEIEKIEMIYNYVRDNFTWNDKYGIYKDVGFKKLLENKTGSIADINLLLINLLKKANIKAVPAVTKTRQRGLLNESFPTLTDLNYVFAYIPKTDGAALALDATSKQIPLGQLPTRAINMASVALYNSGSEVIYLKNPNTYSSQTVSKYDLDIEEEVLNGTTKRKKNNYAATRYRIDLENEDKSIKSDEEEEDDDDEEEEEEINIHNEVTLVKAENIKDLSQPITLDYTEVIRDQVKKIADSYFIDAAIDFGIDKNPFSEESRKYPIFYSYKIDTKYVVTINIPEGYVIESVPETVIAATPNRTASFRYDVKIFEDSLTIYYFIKVNKDIFPHNEYEGLKNLYGMIMDKQSEKIVISKK